MKRKLSMLLLLVMVVTAFSTVLPDARAYAADDGSYTIYDEDGNVLTQISHHAMEEDSYLATNNNYYDIISVDKENNTATARFVETVDLSQYLTEITDAQASANLPAYAAVFSAAYANAQQDDAGSILLYCTHNDESYLDVEGTESVEGNGGIYDVATEFKNNLEGLGIKAVLSDAIHLPHDSSAYRRSRETVVSLIKNNMPVRAVFDIHRDAVPPSEYATTVNGEEMTSVRIVLGKKNQNLKANEELAYKIKAIADEKYPGLMKDIYIGKGEYNQEVSPRSLLFEFGTHETPKDGALTSTKYLADVVQLAMYGGEFDSGSAEATADPNATGEPAEPGASVAPGANTNTNTNNDGGKRYSVDPLSAESKGKGTGWVIGLTIAVLAIAGIYFFVIYGKKGMKERFHDGRHTPVA